MIAKLDVYIFQLGINCYLKDVVKLGFNLFDFFILYGMGTKHYLKGGI
jgi:hypothetical protein